MNDRTKDYVFMSYSHKDWSVIQPFVKALDDFGYNPVYDDSINYGEEWDMMVRRYVTSPNCKGVIFFISENSMTSKPVLEEVELVKLKGVKNFIIMLEGANLNAILRKIEDNFSENKYEIAKNIAENFSKDSIYACIDDVNWDKISRTFTEWGLIKAENKKSEVKDVAYTSEIAGEKERLKNQQSSYYDFDMRAINEVLNTFDQDGLCVIDLGCSNGLLTFSRFGDIEKIKKVIGVDYNKKDIDQANQLAKEMGLEDKFKFYYADLESPDIVKTLLGMLNENGFEKVDLVFSALVLHHLKNPKTLLLRLFDIFSDNGKIILRGSDDGGKLCHPDNDLLQEILSRYNKLVATDRENARKLYEQLYTTGYSDIKMMYSVSDMCGKGRKDRESYYNIGFGFRANRLNEIERLNPDNKEVLEECKWLKEALQKFKTTFYSPSFWYSVTLYIAIAGV